jgi:xylan 1,4-beta-xylosidase
VTNRTCIIGNDGYLFSFFNIDRIFDFLLKIGMRPFVEIGFMPSLMASGTQTWSHYRANVTPPKKWSDWSDLIVAFMQHLIDRYGLDEVLTWNFEVWNEPNCCPHDFWTGSQVRSRSNSLKAIKFRDRA